MRVLQQSKVIMRTGLNKNEIKENRTIQINWTKNIRTIGHNTIYGMKQLDRVYDI